MENNFPEKQTQTTCIEVQEVRPNLIDKLTDLAMENQEVGLIVGSAIGTSIVICAIAHSAAKVIRAVRG
ncbi:MAG: hypothetical protein F6K54_11895 [Okeania sp. SIO3B5]|uniref:hypothetical protein n=1 Tax=Okeania sp. SIO3B5 TaxID=2607811 RepID=UPI0013FFFD7C|nr:hypothetical protein [Okeania sp. SIO3B5]NEO53720.1 hypothetical protein [Okeania sp. SIO3B5]